MSAAVEERGLPSSMDAERSILGAVLLDNGALYDAAWKLDIEAFSLDSHRRIFARMLEMFNVSKPIDIITLSEYLREANQLESIGGVSYLASLTDGVPPRANVEHYVAIVLEKAQLRGLINSSNRIISAILERGTKPADCVMLMQEAISEVNETGKQSRAFAELMNDAIVEIDRLRSVTDTTLGATWNFQPLDDVTTGIRRDEFWVIGARPNVGKTPFGAQIAIANALGLGSGRVRNVEFESLEMSDLQLAMRCLIHAGVTTPYSLRDPRRMSVEEVTEVKSGACRLAELPIWVNDTGSVTIGQLLNRMRYAVRRRKIELFVIDYLQLIGGPGKTAYDRVSASAAALRGFVRETKVPVVALSQLNRNAKDPNKRPELADLRESGVIEQEANGVVLIHRPEISNDENPEMEGQLSMDGEFILAKVREGVKGPEPFQFDENTLTFKPR